MERSTHDTAARDSDAGGQGTGSASARFILIAVILAVFAGLLLAKVTGNEPAPGNALTSTPSITSARNDASADYEAARRSGKPIYVLFHSLS